MALASMGGHLGLVQNWRAGLFPHNVTKSQQCNRQITQDEMKMNLFQQQETQFCYNIYLTLIL